ncbi:MAG: pyridoxamine 5'-phosphate oxidase family protein [Algoriphagus sp.]|nr:pyridoxamine 5'-phosphate oxidase family protein [Algoriphagus sp.]
MNSLTNIQKEGNQSDLTGKEAIEKMRALIDKSSGSCFYCTSNLMDINYSTPISIIQSESNGDLWFLGPKDCFKKKEITQNFEVTLFFPETTHSEFLELKGLVKCYDDTNRIKELRNQTFNSRFKDGLDDERFSMHQFTPENGFYWDKKNDILGEMHFGK